MPYISMCSMYVLASRVRLGRRLFCLGLHCDADKDHLRTLRHPFSLKIWQKGYDADGMWSKQLAIDAAKIEVALLDGTTKQKKNGRKRARDKDDEFRPGDDDDFKGTSKF
jgi:hypothetical protein